MRKQLFLLLVLPVFACTTNQKDEPEHLPNIVYILADDLGYGDAKAYNPDSKINTPNIDKLASEGMRFSDAHSPSSVCTPTRYGILTGRYCWRSKLPVGVLFGYGQSLIEPEETTVAELLKRKGYTTGVVGKWHLGLDWKLKPNHEDSLKIYGDKPILTHIKSDWIDFAKPPSNGPLIHGFDYSYILPASLDMDPYCYLENDTLISIPNQYTPENDPDNGYTGAYWRAGRIAEGFDFYEVLPTFIQKANNFIRKSSEKNTPFFLYLPLAAPHTPWVLSDDYAGKSAAGQYGDFVQMVDGAIGRVLSTLDESEVSKNTIVFFTSDNGPYWQPDFIERFDHRAAHLYRGMKADIWDGGHRIPLIVRWPGKILANSQSDQLTALTNMIATIAEIIGVELNEHEGMDSRSILPVLLGGESDHSNMVIHHSSRGMFAIRTADWKLVEGLGSGGFSKPVVMESEDPGLKGQLYNMKDDPGEQNNLYTEHPEIVEDLMQKLERIKNKK